MDLRAGTYTVTARKTGFKEGVLAQNVQVAAGEVKSLPDFTLLRARGKISGTVRSKGDNIPLPEAKITAKGKSGVVYQTLSANDGTFNFTDSEGRPILLPDEYSVVASKAGFRPDTLAGIALQADQTVQLQFELEKNLGEISGTVTSGGAAVEGATVTATHLASAQYFTAISDEQGAFAIRKIPLGTYQLRVAKTGYTSPPPDTVAAGSTVQLELIKNDGRISGTVTDKETGQPLRGARVYVDDGHGNNAQSYTNSQGNYDIRDLPKTNPYDVTISKSGYQRVQKTAVTVTANTKLDVQLQRLYGNITGKVVGEGQQPMAGVLVRAVNGGTVRADTTGADGAFAFTHIPAASYKLTAHKVGFVSDPVQQVVSLWQGGDVSDVTFVMKEAKAAEIQIIGPELLSNQSRQQYTFVALTADKRAASIEPVWSVDKPAAVDSLSPTGLLDPKNQFIGLVTLRLTDTYSGVSGQKKISVVQPLSPKNTAVTVSDQGGLALTIPDSAVSQNVAIQLRTLTLPPARRATRKFQVLGDVYQLAPENLKLLRPATLTLPVPEGAGSAGGLLIGWWDIRWLEWKPLENTRTQGDQMEADIQQLGRYAVLSLAEPLSLKEIRLTPNPFSPFGGPLKIRYVVTSNKTTSPMVTIKIFNMAGDLVRNLVPGTPQPRGENTVTWDGTTNSGKMARNGRYVLQIRVEDGSGKKEALKTFALIK